MTALLPPYRILIAIIAVCLVACGDAPDDNAKNQDHPREAITIYRDVYGTPQVFADSNYGVFFGYGYAVASDRLFQMEMLKRTAQGRVAEVLGAEFLDLDIKLRTEYNHATVAEQVAALSQRDREVLTGYAAGFNERLEELAQQPGKPLPKPFYDYDFFPTAWTALDVAAIFVGSIAHRYADFNSERDNLAFLRAMEQRHGAAQGWALFNSVKWLLDNTSPTTVPRKAPVNLAAPDRPGYLDEEIALSPLARIVTDAGGRFAGLSNTEVGQGRLRRQLAESGYGLHSDFAPASNYWAVNDLDDAKGALLNGPQFGFAMPSYVYGIGLHGGDFDVVGNTLLALPALLFAHNNHIAWGSTAGISDQTDEFWLRLNPHNPEQYWHQGAWRDFDSWPEQIAVAGAESVTVMARRSVHGMVLAHDPARGIAWSRARAWEGAAVQDLMAWVWLATDQTLEAAEARIADKTTNINMYTMDKTGRLGYVHSGRYPQRAPGHDPRLPAPGDGSMDWQGMRPYTDNPKIRDPVQGYIVNWNNRPAADWVSSDLWPYTWSRADRVHILIDELEGLEPRSVAGVAAINTRSTFEDVNHRYLLPLLDEALAELGIVGIAASAHQLLAGWDRSWRIDKTGHYGAANAIFEAFLRHLQRRVFLDDVGEAEYFRFAATNLPNQPLGASMGTSVALRALVKYLDDRAEGIDGSFDLLNGSSPRQVFSTSFLSAVEELVAQQGDVVSDWRLEAAPMIWQPVNFRGVPQADLDNVISLPGYQNRGSENNVFVATGLGIEARDVVPGGQGGHLDSSGKPMAHRDDQMDLYKAFRHKTLPFRRADVAREAVSEMALEVLYGAP